MKLLILTPYIPYPVNSGGNQYVFGLIDRLRKYVDITIILPTWGSRVENAEALRQLWPDVDVFIYEEKNVALPEVKNPRYFKFLSKLNGSIERKINRQKMVEGSSYMERQHYTICAPFYNPIPEGYINFVSDVLSNKTFDLIQVEFFDLITIVNALPSTIKKVFVHHELRYIKNEREFATLQNPTSVDTYLKEYSKCIELEHLRKYDGVIALTDVDRMLLDEVLQNQASVFSSPAIVNVPAQKELETASFNNKIIFLGSPDHYPNKDGLDWFLNNCWQKIYDQNSNLELSIIGSWKGKVAEVYKARFKNISFTGYVEHLANELKNSIMVIPIRIGSGIRIKALDAIVNGVPIVATSVGVEGLDLVDGRDCFIRDNEQGLAEAILSLANNDEYYQHFRRNAVSKLKTYQDPETALQMRINIYNKILEEKK